MGVETLMIAAAAAAAGGKLIEGVSGYRQAQYNAQVAKEQARQNRYDSAVEIQLGLNQAARDTGQGITIAAKQGGGYDGSAMDVLSDLNQQHMYEARRISAQAKAFDKVKKAEAKQTMSQAKIQLLGSVVSAAGSAASIMAGMPTKPSGATAPTAPAGGGGSGTIMTDAMRPRVGIRSPWSDPSWGWR